MEVFLVTSEGGGEAEGGETRASPGEGTGEVEDKHDGWKWTIT